ncbi:MAG: hypothetical protein RLZZ546_77, partial [Bacteroidota bacterium]
MKLIHVIALLFLFSIAESNAQSVAKDRHSPIQMKYFDRNCDPEFELLEHGEVWRRKEIKAYVDAELSQPKSYIRTNKFDFIKVNVHKKFAWVDYWNTAKITLLKDNSTRELKWLESIILEKRKGKWVLLQ